MEPAPACITAMELREDGALWQTNAAIQVKINQIRGQLKTGLGITDNDFIHLPAIYVAEPGVTNAFAMVPNMVNNVSLNSSIVLPNPRGPRWGTGLNEDVFLAEAISKLNGGGRMVVSEDFVDNWDLYHRFQGEVHCGTNTRRFPDAIQVEWWKNLPNP
jgi:protein-arginine deiminase